SIRGTRGRGARPVPRRAALPTEQVLLAADEEAQGESPRQPLQRGAGGRDGRGAAVDLALGQQGDGFGIGLGFLSIAVGGQFRAQDRKSTRLNSSHVKISYAVFCL